MKKEMIIENNEANEILNKLMAAKEQGYPRFRLPNEKKRRKERTNKKENYKEISCGVPSESIENDTDVTPTMVKGGKTIWKCSHCGHEIVKDYSKSDFESDEYYKEFLKYSTFTCEKCKEFAVKNVR